MISVIVPCFNEELNVQPLYERLCTSLKGYEYEIIFVDDGSSDGTLKQVRKLHNEDCEHVLLISFSRNFGKEAAIYAGLEHMNGDYGAILDADLQQSPELVAQMLQFLMENEEYDIVAMYQERRIEKKFISWAKIKCYQILNQMCEVDFYNGASDFRIFRKCVADALVNLPECYRFSKGLFSWIGFKTYYQPYVAEERYSGKSKWSLRRLINYGLEGLLAFSTFPLRVALYLGLFVSFSSFVYMLVIVVEHFVLNNAVSGYATIVCLILMSSGVQTMLLGILGEYIGKTYMQGKNRPKYIVREIMKKDH